MGSHRGVVPPFPSRCQPEGEPLGDEPFEISIDRSETDGGYLFPDKRIDLFSRGVIFPFRRVSSIRFFCSVNRTGSPQLPERGDDIKIILFSSGQNTRVFPEALLIHFLHIVNNNHYQ